VNERLPAANDPIKSWVSVIFTEKLARLGYSTTPDTVVEPPSEMSVDTSGYNLWTSTVAPIRVACAGRQSPINPRAIARYVIFIIPPKFN
jgi:hypothetical protein